MVDNRYINAEKVIGEIERIYCTNCNIHSKLQCGCCEYMDCMDIIEDYPSEDTQKIVHAKWINKSEEVLAFIKYIYECSNCGYTIGYKPKSRSDGKGNKFCDECGAKMDLEE